ncbi:MAG: hypothetical protein PUD24_00215 [Oscillospiraceae bacterium]|nr:hypothetical protein [Oscillospiraceae bacterium]
MKKKKIIIIVIICLAVAAVAGTVFGVKAYNDYITQQQIEERIKSIDDTYSDFETETDRSKKLEILSDFIKNKPSTADEISIEVLNSVEPKYDEFIKKMQNFFTDDYDKVIKDNSISSDNLTKMNDKKKIQNYIDKLNSLKETMESEKSTVFYENNENDAYSYVNKTDDLINSYNDRLQAIEKAEKEKAEAEKKAAEEKKKQDESQKSNNNINNGNADADGDYSSNESNSYNGTDNGNYNNNYYGGTDGNYSGNNSSGGTANNSGSGNYDLYWYTDGETGEITYHDSNGNHWDDDGNTWTDEDLEGFMDGLKPHY